MKTKKLKNELRNIYKKIKFFYEDIDRWIYINIWTENSRRNYRIKYLHNLINEWQKYILFSDEDKKSYLYFAIDDVCKGQTLEEIIPKVLKIILINDKTKSIYRN